MASRPSPSADIWCMVPVGLLWSSSTILTKTEESAEVAEVFGGRRELRQDQFSFRNKISIMQE